MARDPAAAFPPTRHSLLSRLGEPGEAARREAFAALAAAYWRPIYSYLRLGRQLESADAEDLTQGFLAAAWEQGFLARHDPARARFRTFLRVCLDRYAAGERRKQRAQKRGGGGAPVSLDFGAAEQALLGRELEAPGSAEALFRQEFIRQLFADAVTDLQAELERRGRGAVFAVFERYDLGSGAGVRYADAGRELDLTVTQVTNYLHAARRRFRELVLLRLRALCGSDQEYREEAREILGVDVA
jgi:DNA-directed RNA polymerase specialized sigma24 family protein